METKHLPKPVAWNSRNAAVVRPTQKKREAVADAKTTAGFPFRSGIVAPPVIRRLLAHAGHLRSLCRANATARSAHAQFFVVGRAASRSRDARLFSKCALTRNSSLEGLSLDLWPLSLVLFPSLNFESFDVFKFPHVHRYDGGSKTAGMRRDQ